MVPLGILGIASNLAFIAYGTLQPAVPILVLHCVLLPLNALRLHQMLRLTRQVAAASRSDLNLDWLMPYGTRRRVRAAQVLFRKGEAADRMVLVVSGGLRIPELGLELGPGELAGELGLITPGRRRTQTVTGSAAGRDARDQLRPGPAALLPEPGVRLLLPRAHGAAAIRHDRAAGGGGRRLPAPGPG